MPSLFDRQTQHHTYTAWLLSQCTARQSTVDIFCLVTFSKSCFKFILGICHGSPDSLVIVFFRLLADTVIEKQQTDDFHFHHYLFRPFRAGGVFGNEFLTRIYWCQLEPVFHFLLDSSRNMSCLMRDVRVFVLPNLKHKTKGNIKELLSRFVTLFIILHFREDKNAM